jgi:hypothetical protein
MRQRLSAKNTRIYGWPRNGDNLKVRLSPGAQGRFMQAQGFRSKNLIHNLSVLGFLLVMAFVLLAARRASPETGPATGPGHDVVLKAASSAH